MWTQRVERLGSLGIKTYIAALGGALLAKATNAKVDSLTQDRKAGARGYSLRSVTELLQSENNGRYHLGTPGKYPLNNRPFLGGPGRIDEFEKISSSAQPAFDLFLDCLVHLDKLSKAEASSALAAFLRIRMAVQKSKAASGQPELPSPSGISMEDLLGISERFVRHDPEHGRRAQAFAAAVLDCVFPDVLLQPINSPHPGDVRVLGQGAVRLPVEVKQVSANESVGMALAADAAKLGATSALLFVVATDQKPLNRERLRRRAMREHGVAIEVCESVREFVGLASTFSGGRLSDIREQLPQTYAKRMAEHEVSEKGQRRWKELVEARASTVMDS